MKHAKITLIGRKNNVKLTNKTMKKMQEIFNRTQETKKDIKELKSIYKDALNNSQNYREIIESKSVEKAIGKKTVELYKNKISKLNKE